MSKIAIIGAGFSGLSAAAYLSAAGEQVHVFEKNALPGGRARQMKTGNGYVFDMGPSWYWMPDVFERFFKDFGYTPQEFYDLKLLDPSFEIVFSNQQTLSIPNDFEQLCSMFETLEAGAAEKLKQFMNEAQYKYKAAMKKLIHMPGLSVGELFDFDLLKGVFRLQVFSSFSKHVRKYFSNPMLIALMEFPVLFLGAMPQDTPALYSLMNYAGMKLGTWYPKGGIGKVIEAMVRICKEFNVVFHFNTPVEKIEVEKNKAKGIVVNGSIHSFDGVIASADYQHVESKLLQEENRNYPDKYWEKKVFAPSCLIYYIGLSKKIKSFQHHTLFFEENFDTHAKEIYKQPQWPSKPLFYACCPSRTDDSVAPPGHENIFLLMPIAAGLKDDEAVREKYFHLMLNRLKQHLGEDLEPYIDFKKSYCTSDFIQDYNAYKGNAYGLANTLMQTAFMKPKLRNKKVSNLFYAGQLTVPGPGVPPAIISGKIAATELMKHLNSSAK